MTKVILVGAKDDSLDKNVENNTNEKKEKIKQSLSVYTKVPIAILISFISYLLVRSLVPDEIVWWGVELIAFILSLLIIVAIDAASSKKSTIGLSVLLFSFIMFSFFMIRGYTEHKDDVKDNISQVNKIYYVEYRPGIYDLHLSKNQKSGWIKVKGAYNFNKDATLVLEYASGAVVNSWDPGKWRNEYTFQIINVGDSPVELIVR
ncbi:hypothetical protein JXE04_00465 [Patescibacteria group bacterium]|nr:hypothetical protein [Patescibacteria group bacterium]